MSATDRGFAAVTLLHVYGHYRADGCAGNGDSAGGANAVGPQAGSRLRLCRVTAVCVCARGRKSEGGGA
jgi:hypothetical protein